MVSFQCDGCADTVKKPKLDQHRQRCWASFTCLDCSKTFQNQEYKSHTSCISEAEKYQGALYKGPRKGQQQQHQAKPAAVPTSTPAPAPAAAAAPAPAPVAAIHPSRLNQIENAPADFHSGGYGRGAGPSARGRGGVFARGRGAQISGENKRAPEGGMRSWGTSPAVTDSEPSTPVPTVLLPTTAAPAPAGKENDKKRRKKGDKGGTGSKANSKHPRGESVAASEPPTTASDEPAQKKRKRSTSPAPASAAAETTAGDAISDKTLKRLRKNAAKVGEKSPSLSLDEWVKRIAEVKKEQIDVGDVNKAAKVSFEDGKWILSF